MANPPNLLYTEQHEWLRIDGAFATVGLTEFAADALGDIVYVELPAVGTTVSAGQPCGEIESTKSVSELYAPANGAVVEVNSAVVDDPGLLNTDPFGQGWLLKLDFTTTTDLLDAAAYEALVNRS